MQKITEALSPARASISNSHWLSAGPAGLATFLEHLMSTDTPGNPPILLRLPSEVGLPLLRDAKKRKCTVQAVILEIVGAHYRVVVDPPRRGGKKKVE